MVSDKNRKDRDVIIYAVKGALRDGANEVSMLEQLKEDDKARIPHEENLKKSFVFVYDEVLDRAQFELSKGDYINYIASTRSDEQSTPGIQDHSVILPVGIVTKIKEGRGDISPHTLHKVNVDDWKFFENDKNFHMAKIYDVIKQTDPYVMIQDRYSAATSKKKTFIQVQEHIPGKNIAQLAPRNGTKIIDKAIKDIFYWHKKAPALEEKIDIEKINKGYMKDLDDAVENAVLYTNCTLSEDEDEVAFTRAKSTMQILLNSVDFGYGRVLDSVLRNIMLRLDSDKLAKEDGAYLEKLAKDEEYINENLIHIDPRERYGHIYEDLHNLDSEVSRYMLVHGKRMFKRGSRNLFREHIAKNSDQKFSDIAFELIGSIRAMRRRDYTISRYTKRLFKTRETRPNFGQELENYAQAVRCLDTKAAENANNLAELLKEQNYAHDADNIRNFAKFIKKLYFTKFTFEHD